MIGLIAVGSETTRLSAETIGNTWKSVLARMEQVKAGAKIDEEGEAINNVEKVLNKFGIQLRDSTSEFRNMEDVLDEVGNKWNTFDGVAQAQIATAIAGTHRINTFVATMENYDTVLKYTEESQDAAGTSAQKYTAYMDSIDAKLNTLTATWEQFVNNLNQSGTVKSVIDLGTKLIGVLDTLINKMGLLKVALPAAVIALLATKVNGLIQHFTKLGTTAKSVKTILGTFNAATTLSSEKTQELGVTLAGLTLKERVVVLNTTNLTDAQKELVLVASGIPAAEAAAEIAIQNAGNAAKKASVDMKALTSGMKISAGASKLGIAIGAITTVISLAKGAVDLYNQKVQESIDKANEMERAYKDFTTESERSLSTLQGLQKEFTQLSAGVTDYGENISLSAEDYQRYKDIVSQILEISPKLIEGYNLEGQAIANKNGLIENSIKLLQDSQDTELREFVVNIPDIGKGLKEELKKAQGELTTAKYDLQQALKTAITLDPSSVSGGVNSLRNQVLDAFKKDDGTFYELGELVRTRTEDVFKYLMKNSDKLTEEAVAHINSAMEKQMLATEKVAEAQKALNPSLQIVPKVVEGYSELSDSTKQFISGYINQFRLATNQNDKTWEQWVQNIKDFTGMIVGLGPDIQDAINSVFSLDPSKFSADEYKNQVEGMLEIILDSIDGMDDDAKAKIRASVMVQLGLVVVDENGNEIDTQQQMIDELRHKVDGKFFFSDLDTSDWTYEDFKLALKVDTSNIQSVEEFNEAMYELRNQAQDTKDAIGNLSTSVSDAVTNFADKMKDLDSGYSTLKTAVDEFNNSGHISASTLKTLSENDFIQYLEVVNGKLEINTEALGRNVSLAKSKAKQEVITATYNKLLALSEDDVTTATETASSASADTAQSVSIMGTEFGKAASAISSTTTLLDAYNRTSGKSISDKNYKAAQQAIRDMYKNLSLIDKLAISDASKSGGGSASSKRSEALKEEKKNIEDLIDAYIKMRKQELKEEKDAENARYEITKRNFEDEQTAMKRRFRDAKQHYEDLNKVQEEGAEARLDALEAEYDAYKKKIDAEKDLLKAKKEEEEYEKSLAEKTKDVAKIQSELAKLQFDDSIEAQKKRIELMEQLSEKQGDLDEFQNDHRYDVTEDALDKESDRYKDLYDERKKEIEDEKKAWKDLYDARIDALEREQTKWEDDFDNRKTKEQRAHEDRVNQIENEINNEKALRSEAITAIESQSDAVRQKLVEWNRVYGTGIDEDINSKWRTAIDLLEKYKSQGIGLQGILEIIAQEMDRIKETTTGISSVVSGVGDGVNKWKTYFLESKKEAMRVKKQLKDMVETAKEIEGLRGIELVPGITKHNQKDDLHMKYHTGTDYVAMNANDRLLNKSLGLKSDEVVRILKVGEAVIPKERNLKRLRENSDFVENSSLRRLSELSEVSQGGISDNSSHISISIGDTIVQGDADNNIVNRLNEYKNSLVNEVFSRINKHTNLSGFRSSKRYV